MRLILIIFLIAGNVFAKDTNKIKAQEMYQGIKEHFKEVPEIKLSEIDSLVKSDQILFIDVREDEERKLSVIPGAISKEKFEKNLDKYKNKKVAAYCTIGYRSAKYIMKLKKKGIKAYNLEGSLLGWVHDGRPVVSKSGKESKKVHVYGRSWNHLPEGLKGEW